MNINRSAITVPLISLFALFSVVASAQNNELTFESETISYEQDSKKTLFEGEVVVIRGELELFADSVEHYWDSDQGEYILAKGNLVRFKHQDTDNDREVRGSSSELIYRIKENEIQLTGNVTIKDDRATFRTYQATYNIDSGELNATSKSPDSQGGERLKSTITIDDDN